MEEQDKALVHDAAGCESQPAVNLQAPEAETPSAAAPPSLFNGKDQGWPPLDYERWVHLLPVRSIGEGFFLLTRTKVGSAENLFVMNEVARLSGWPLASSLEVAFDMLAGVRVGTKRNLFLMYQIARLGGCSVRRAYNRADLVRRGIRKPEGPWPRGQRSDKGFGRNPTKELALRSLLSERPSLALKGAARIIGVSDRTAERAKKRWSRELEALASLRTP